MKFIVLLLLCVTSYSSEIFEGDIILSKKQALKHYGKTFTEKHQSRFDDDKQTAGLEAVDNPWKVYRDVDRYVIPYTYPVLSEVGQANLLQESSKVIIESAMRHVEEKAEYVKFVPKDSSHTFWLNIGHFTSGCHSYVGRRLSLENQGQTLNLGIGCVTIGTVAHELLHALGIYHEQSRYDRDNYVEVKMENIDEENQINFEKQTSDNSLGIEYDYGSVMHYGEYAFSNNTKKTIISPQPIGQRNGLSNPDALLLKYLYRCTYHDKGAATHCTTTCPCPENFHAHCTDDTVCEGGVGCQEVSGLEPLITKICGGTRSPTKSPTKQPTSTTENIKGIWDDFTELYTDNLEISIVITVIVASTVFSFFRWLLCSPTVLKDYTDPGYSEVPRKPQKPESAESAMKYII